MADRHIFRGLNSIKFNQRFKQEEDCLRYLAEVKWSDGYNCRRCSNDKFGTGKNVQGRRCSKCRYDESPTSGTMFEKIKFSILIAFHYGRQIHEVF